MRMMFMVTAFVAVCIASAGAVQVTVNQNTRYQTVEGIGGFGLMPGLGYGTSPSTCCPNSWLDTVVGNLGVSLIRHEIDPFYSPSEGVFDPSRLNLLKKFCFTRLRDRNIRLIGSVWSPPCWMKENRSCYPEQGNNVLEPRYYDAFGDFLVQYIQMIKDSTGIELFGVSPQNEPYFNNPFNSCFYNGATYAAMLQVVGPKIRAAFPNVKIIGPEHMCDFDWNVGVGYIDNLLRGAPAEQYLDAFAVHYSEEQEWPRFYQETFPRNKQLWQTETSGFNDTWQDCQRYSELGRAQRSGEYGLFRGIQGCLAESRRDDRNRHGGIGSAQVTITDGTRLPAKFTEPHSLYFIAAEMIRFPPGLCNGTHWKRNF